MQKVVLLSFVFLFSIYQSLAQLHPSVSKGPESSWVEKLTFDKNVEGGNSDAGDHYHLLYDRQANVEKEEEYRHFVIHLLNESGVQEMSNLEIVIDPKFQKLTFHEINVYRDGKKIDKLKTHAIQSFQRETSLDRFIYDGSITAFVNLEDIRVGDILEYSYSRQGYNPINKGLFDFHFQFEFGIPVKRIHTKLILPENEKVFFYRNKPDSTITEEIIHSENTYVWNRENVKAVFQESNIPSWYDVYASVQISNVKNWASLAKWGVGLFAISDHDKSMTKKLVDTLRTGDMEKDIISLVQFVQNEIRYFGLEDGLSGYKPHAPSKILEQRYGDCKDKSLLLASALNELGVEAYPMLVNSSTGLALDKYLPAITDFNHCVVKFSYLENDYFIDPTMSMQGGGLDDYYFPSYFRGLVLAPNTTDLTVLPINENGFTEVNETFRSRGLLEPVEFDVVTTYEGKRADFIRDYLKGNTIKKVSNDYLDYYASIYPSIELVNDVEWSESVNGENVIETVETYSIPEMWQKTQEDSNVMSLETYPIILRDIISLVKTPERNMPYYLNHPSNLSHITRIIFHEPWNIESEYDNVDQTGIKYDNTIVYDPENYEVVIRESYETNAHFIEAEDYKEYRNTVESILNETGFYATINVGGDSSNDDYSRWLDYLMLLLAIGVAIYLLLFLYAQYFQ